MKVVWTLRASRSLAAIRTEIASEQPRAAERIGEEIRKTANILGMWPLVGGEFLKGARYFPVPGTKYIILYRVHLEQVSIILILVVHGAMDWRNRPM